MTVDVQIACSERAPAAGEIAAWAHAALAGDGRSLCLRVVDEAEGAELNGRFRSRRGATNVLAFPAGERELLGDIAICAPVAAREARQQRKRLADHYAHLVVHGVLHLLGLDHRTAAQAEVMEAKEVELLGHLGVADPYCHVDDASASAQESNP